MRKAFAGFALLAAMAFAAPASAQQACEGTAELHAHRIAGPVGNGAEVAGSSLFSEALPNGWVFVLVPAPHGWNLRLYDHANIGDAVDLTAQTPPMRGPANPRDLFGWHFRNAANTGPNEGDVNAPQHLRAFVISPGIAGTGGLRPPEGPIEPSAHDGIGTLRILDMGLADLKPGQKARMTYLKFDACLRWPKTEEERQVEANAASPEFIDEEIEIFGSCGLDLATYELETAILPRLLGGDFDGDDAIDEAAQIRRRSDGARGVALCRAGTWMQVIGFEPLEDLRPGYITQMEAWRLVPKDHDGFASYEGAPPWPAPEGDVLVLERIEKELLLVYWKDGAWHSQQVYRFVEL